MPTFKITSPEGKTYNITAPEGATKEEALTYFKSNHKVEQPQRQVDPYKQAFSESPPMEKFLIGAGGGMTGLYKGAKQRLGLADQEEIDEYRKSMKPVNESGYGMAGNITGKIAGTIPAAFIPGANTIAGASLVGGGMGLLEPTLKDESVLANTAIGGVGGAIGQKLGSEASKQLIKYSTNKASKIAQQKAADALRNQTLMQSHQAGYVVPPSQAGAGMGSRVLEGLSGKYKTNQLAGINNQNITNVMAKKALGITDDLPITKEGLQQIRNDAFDVGYKPLNSLGQIAPDEQYYKSLDDIVASRNTAKKSFPGMKDDSVAGVVDELRVNNFDSAHAMEKIKLNRELASEAYRKGDNGLGRAYKASAKALEDQIERSAGQIEGAEDLLKSFRDSRKLMAKTHSIEKALIESSGDVDAKALTRQLKRGTPLETELKKVAKFGQSFPDVAGVPKSGHANPLTIIDMGYGAAAGAGIDPTMLALPAGRVASRYGILSPKYQTKFVTPKYGNANLSKASGELLGSETMQALIPRLTAMGLLDFNQ